MVYAAFYQMPVDDYPKLSQINALLAKIAEPGTDPTVEAMAIGDDDNTIVVGFANMTALEQSCDPDQDVSYITEMLVNEVLKIVNDVDNEKPDGIYFIDSGHISFSLSYLPD